MKTLGIILLMPVVFLAGCSSVPQYERPAFPAATTWSHESGGDMQNKPESAELVAWQDFFVSPELRQVIETALEQNYDLRTAALNIEEARAIYRVQRADLLPDINATGEASIQTSSDESSVTGKSEQTEIYRANLGLASYEIDLFGKIRSRNESALNEYYATEEAGNVVRNTLIAETANAYLQLLADVKLLGLTEKTLQAQQKTFELLSQSQKNGIAAEIDVARAATAVETAKVNLAQYRQFVAQDRNALILLMGTQQDAISIPEITLDDVQLLEELKSGLPSEVLLNRPDIRRAEYSLIARNADIGTARAAFFPSISLTGTYGFASDSLSNLFTGGAAGAWTLLPQITVPIFQAGRNQADLDIARIRKDKAVVGYERAIQTAFREVADELATREALSEQLEAQRRLVSASQKVYDLTQARYKAGIDSFLSVLDGQRELYAAEQNKIIIERQRLSNLVNLYKVLGGGS